MWNVEPTPTVRATYLLVKCLEERIIATYFTLIQQPIYHLSFCGNLSPSPTLCVHPMIPDCDSDRQKIVFCCSFLGKKSCYIFQTFSLCVFKKIAAHNNVFEVLVHFDYIFAARAPLTVQRTFFLVALLLFS